MENWINLQNTFTLARLSCCLENQDDLPYRVRELLPLNGREEVEQAENFYKSR